MSRLSRSSSSSLEDACGTEEEKSSPLDLCHVDDVDTEESYVSKYAVAMVASVANDCGSRCYRCRICGEVKENQDCFPASFHRLETNFSNYSIS